MFQSLMFQRRTIAEIAHVSEISRESVLALDYFIFLVVVFWEEICEAYTLKLFT